MGGLSKLAVKAAAAREASKLAVRAAAEAESFYFDNPGVTRGEDGRRWLADKVSDAKAAEAKGFKTYGPITGSSERHLDLPVSFLEKIPGARGEIRAPGDAQYDHLLAKAQKEGFKPTPILLGINYKGDPYIVEGNTRVAVGKSLGASSIPAEIRYYAGGETNAKVGFKPSDLVALASPKARGGRVSSFAVRR